LRSQVGSLPSAGALMQAPLLYVLVRATKPERLIETGVSSGYSARLILEALRRNGSGRLHSIGIPKIAHGAIDRPDEVALQQRSIGWLVTEDVRDRWSLHVGPAETLLQEVLNDPSTSGLDLFLHDSLHLYDHMSAEYRAAWPHLRPGGYLLSHDIHNNPAWRDFLAVHHLSGDEELDRDLGIVRVPSDAGVTPPRTAPG
ncbi:MAG: class I SAM-dependent methyltransferase, partial [Thermoplasmata archaeon]|nr:class I SAM-dependent methyltransferase [Thermoplasmata archaeon]